MRSRIPFLVFLGFFLPVYGYVIYRAVVLGFTHDEALTYTLLTGDGAMLHNANNHPLNSLLAKGCSLLFGYGEWSLRLPNVLAFAGYGWGVWRLIRQVKQPVAACVAFGLLVLNPFTLDFFSLCRGYGLALAASLVALVFFLREKPGIALWFAVAAVYANYAFLHLYAALALGWAVTVFWRERKAFRTRVIRPAWPTAAALIPALVHMALLQSKQQLYYGGEHSVFSDSLWTLLGATLYNQAPPPWLAIFLGSVVALLLLVALVVAWKKKHRTLWLTAVALAASLVLPTILHAAVGIRFPIQRGALFYTILLAVLVTQWVAVQPGKAYLRWIWMVFPLAAGLNTASHVNGNYTATWAYDAYNKEVLERINADRGGQTQVQLQTHWLFQPSFRYYQETRYGDWMLPVERVSEYDPETDYAYVLQDEVAKLPTHDTFLAYPQVNSVLLRVR